MYYILGLYIGIMEKNMETIILGLYRVLYRLYRYNGKENGNYRVSAFASVVRGGNIQS